MLTLSHHENYFCQKLKCGEIFCATATVFNVSCCLCKSEMHLEQFANHFQSKHLTLLEDLINQELSEAKRKQGILSNLESSSKDEIFTDDPIKQEEVFLPNTEKPAYAVEKSSQDEDDNKCLQKLLTNAYASKRRSKSKNKTKESYKRRRSTRNVQRKDASAKVKGHEEKTEREENTTIEDAVDKVTCSYTLNEETHKKSEPRKRSNKSNKSNDITTEDTIEGLLEVIIDNSTKEFTLGNNKKLKEMGCKKGLTRNAPKPVPALDENIADPLEENVIEGNLQKGPSNSYETSSKNTQNIIPASEDKYKDPLQEEFEIEDKKNFECSKESDVINQIKESRTKRSSSEDPNSGPIQATECPEKTSTPSLNENLVKQDAQDNGESENEWFADEEVSANETVPNKGTKGGAPLPCPICGRTYRTKHSLRNHKYVVHNPNARKRGCKDPKPQHKCAVCNEVFRSASILEAHKWKHTGIFCDVCGKSFSQLGNMIRHKIRHTGKKDFKCKECDKEFFTLKELKSHLICHTGLMPWICEICGKPCRDRGVLTAHMRRHTGERPAKCEVCGKSFYSFHDLNVHAVTHTTERPFKCDTCGSTFQLKKALRIHKLTHSQNHKHTCRVCGKGFAQSSGLNSHMRTHDAAVEPGQADTLKMFYIPADTAPNTNIDMEIDYNLSNIEDPKN